MIKYLMKRLLISIVVFFGITISVYFISSLAPGSPLEMMMTPTMSQADMDLLKEKMGLDQPVYVQYGRWLSEFMHGNFGYSFKTGKPIAATLVERIQPTLVLMITSTILAILISVPLGVLAACRPYSALDYISSGIAFLGAATPTFFLALIGIYFFSIKLGVLPVSGMTAAGNHSLMSYIHHMLLPVGVLCFSLLGSLIRQARSSMLEVINDDYVRTARAKGLSERKVIFRHAMKNAMIPIVAQIGTMVPFIIGGSVVVEQIFGWPGIGSWMVSSIGARDYPVIMALTVVIAVTVLVCNIVVDTVYSILDPRIRYDS